MNDTEMIRDTYEAEVIFFLINYCSYPIGLISVVANLLVVISSTLIQTSAKPKSTYIILGNLALADSVLGIVSVMGLQYINTRAGIKCDIILGLIEWCAVESVLSTLVNALDRYIYIKHGLYYCRWMSTRRAGCMVLATWLLSLIVGFLPKYLFTVHDSSHRFCQYFNSTPFFVTIITGSVSLSSVVVTIVLYGAISRTAKSARKTSDNLSKRKATLKSKMIVLVTTCNVVTMWSGSYTGVILHAIYCRADTSYTKFENILNFLGINACLVYLMMNPLIYVWWLTGFRKATLYLCFKQEIREKRRRNYAQFLRENFIK